MRSIQGIRVNPRPAMAMVMVAMVAAAAMLLTATPSRADSTTPLPTIRVVSDQAGQRLQVDGRDFMVLGMNWDYYPIGTNYSYDLWSQPDDFIQTALEREMPLLRGMGVNAVRLGSNVPPRWVRYIYERYGIFTVVNHTIGRYGYTLDGVWYKTVDYSDPRFRDALKGEMLALVEQFRGTPGVLM